MELLTSEQVANLLESATIDDTQDYGHTITHSGTTEAGQRFTLMNNWEGHSCVSYQL